MRMSERMSLVMEVCVSMVRWRGRPQMVWLR